MRQEVRKRQQERECGKRGFMELRKKSERRPGGRYTEDSRKNEDYVEMKW